MSLLLYEKTIFVSISEGKKYTQNVKKGCYHRSLFGRRWRYAKHPKITSSSLSFRKRRVCTKYTQDVKKGCYHRSLLEEDGITQSIKKK
jgi:hypothetical protein